MTYTVTDQYVLFWNGPFSQWHKSIFTENDVTYTSAEQYMMECKAILFNDVESAKAILSTNNPRTIKALGKKVKNFDEEIWKKHREKIVLQATRLKFSQDSELKHLLMSYDNLVFVEASPYDVIWGIGLSEDDPRCLDESKWKGLNLLGKCITTIRDEFAANL